MTLLAEFTLPVGGFPLGRVFADHPDLQLDLDRVVPTGDTVMPYFWAEDPERDLAAVRAAFAELPELRSVVLMEDLGERGLFRAEWDPAYMGIMAAIANSDVTVLSATGTREGWMFELRADSGDALSAFQQECIDRSVNVTLTRLSHLSERAAGETTLTPDQREALVLAYREGYYGEPREEDLATLAGRLGISRQALSARLRRGYRNLIETAVLQGNGEADAPDRP